MTADTGFDRAGPPASPAILLVHGSVVTRAIWQPQLRALSYRFRVLAPDLPDHSAPAATPFTFDNAVDTPVRIIETHARGSALLAGLSLGGYVAPRPGRLPW